MVQINGLYLKDDSFRPFNWSGSASITLNGDEAFLPTGTSMTRINLSTAITIGSTYNIDLRMRATNANGTLGFTLLDVLSNPIVTYTIPVSTSVYSWYSVFSIPVPTLIAGLTLSSIGANEVDLDYFCFTTNVGTLSSPIQDSVDYGGLQLDATIGKKTYSRTVPNSSDIIQQLGLASRSETILLPKLSRAAYNSFETKALNNTPIEVVFSSNQQTLLYPISFTGYIADVSAHTEAGWVGVGIGSSSVGQLYDVTLTVIKADDDTINTG